MSTSIIALTLLFALASPAHADSIVGRWRFYKKIYMGHEMPESPAATLRMQFEFSGTGESRLSWHHIDENDHCLRVGKYRVEGAELVEEVVWVDPKNTEHCAEDPDMQLGRKTRTPFYFTRGDLALRFHLGDEPLDLVWTKNLEEP